MDVGVQDPKKSIWKDLPEEVDQIWAEACAYATIGESLILPPEIEAMAVEQQEKHREESGKEGMIRDFLDRKIPSNWDSLSLRERRMYWQGNYDWKKAGVHLMDRDKVCVMEIWSECFGFDPGRMSRRDSMEINNILTALKGWERNKATRRYGPHGTQRGFQRGVKA